MYIYTRLEKFYLQKSLGPNLNIGNLFSNIIHVVVWWSRTLINKSARGIYAEAGVVGGICKGGTRHWNILIAGRVGVIRVCLLLLLLLVPRPHRSREMKACTGSCSCCMEAIMIPPVRLCRGRDCNTITSTVDSAFVSH